MTTCLILLGLVAVVAALTAISDQLTVSVERNRVGADDVSRVRDASELHYRNGEPPAVVVVSFEPEYGLDRSAE
jgi:hypothetical protein